MTVHFKALEVLGSWEFLKTMWDGLDLFSHLWIHQFSEAM